MTFAHGVVAPGDAWSAWEWDPTVITVVTVTALGYAIGVARLPHNARRAHASRGRVVAFFAGVVVLAAALVSPLDALAETLFSVHMAQHLTLIFVAAPLLAHGLTTAPLIAVVPVRLRRVVRAAIGSPAVTRARRLVGGAAVVVSLHAVALWVWHLPYWYGRALDSSLLHGLEHVCFVVTAFLFWKLVLNAGVHRSQGVAIACVFATAMQSGALGAVLTFASRPLYQEHVAGARTWEITPLADQQLAGVVMWVPAGVVYLVVMAILFLKWLNVVEQRMRAAEAGSLTGAGRR